eukprot:TRINITY_DN19924_c0_g1_i3.p2 TRINITY_DN19924_c0_g1~~TRINITY_DN19924_c0_g1_i3.p2  ORF type:complete len:341 (+),score=132.85 TRINITY_DN19924_c0_g1_i3:96-1118(+)
MPSYRDAAARPAARPASGAKGADRFSPEQKLARLFGTIQAAQDGVRHTSYRTALKEMRQGRKTSHWIWYVWPSLRALRPGTQRPHFLLPDFATARRYLTADVLAARLEEITAVALEQMRAGVPVSKLLGSSTDATKFRESCTVFAIAAALGTHESAERQCALFCDCIDEAERGEPAWKTASLRAAAARGSGEGRGAASRRAVAGSGQRGQRPSDAADEPRSQRQKGPKPPEGPAPPATLDQRAVEAVVADPDAPKATLGKVKRTDQLRDLQRVRSGVAFRHADEAAPDAPAPEEAAPDAPAPEEAAPDAPAPEEAAAAERCDSAGEPGDAAPAAGPASDL